MAPPQTSASALLTANHLYLLEFNHDALPRKLPAVTRCPIYEQLGDVTKYRLFCLDSPFSLSVSPLLNFLTSLTPLHPFGTLVAAPWPCSPGARGSCRSGLPSGDTRWGGIVPVQVVAPSRGALTTLNIHVAWDLVVFPCLLVEGGMREVPVPPFSSSQTLPMGRSCWGAFFAPSYHCFLQQKHHGIWFTAWETTAGHRLNPAVGRSLGFGKPANLLQFSGALWFACEIRICSIR